MRYLLALFIFTGCTSFLTSPVMDEGVNYQRDVVLHVKYVKSDRTWSPYHLIEGAGVMPKSSQYKVKVFPPGKADMITLTSCHREEKTPNPKANDGWFSKGFYEFDLILQNTVDSSRLCSFDIGVYEKEKGRHAWGLLAISDLSKYNLPGRAKCNGKTTDYNGTSVCQAKKGLIQEYIFDRKVSVTKVVGCEIANLATDDKYSNQWRFIMPEGECELFFIDVKNPLKKVHQAFLYGYDKLPIRGLQ